MNDKNITVVKPELPLSKKAWETPELQILSVNNGPNNGNFEGMYSDGKGGPRSSHVDATFHFYIHS